MDHDHTDDYGVVKPESLVSIYCMIKVILLMFSNDSFANPGSFQAGINPDATLHHPGSKAASIGIRCGLAVAELALHDTLNLLGNITGRKYNLVPYSDYTGYAPVNTAYKLNDPTRWQPLINPVKNSLGQFAEQVGLPSKYLKDIMLILYLYLYGLVN